MITAKKLIGSVGEGQSEWAGCRRQGGTAQTATQVRQWVRRTHPGMQASACGRGKGRATAAAGQPLYTCAGKQIDPTKVVKLA